MDYDMTRLGDKQFEHLAQALLVKYLGPQVRVFGAGPDGGREAIWNGRVSDSRLPNNWNGYGVAQAKYMAKPGDPAKNSSWLRKQIAAEFHEWTRADTKRSPLPEYYLIITNVTLSAAAGGGIDTIYKAIHNEAQSHGLPLKDFSVWHYDQIRVLLDDASEIRRTYAAWTTPGDVLAEFIDIDHGSKSRLTEALRVHAARVLVDDNHLNLTQAGAVSDSRPAGISDVFMDLPAHPPRFDSLTKEEILPGYDDAVLPGITNELIELGNTKGGISSISSEYSGPIPGRAVLIGGPGQGKSTISQYLSQIYRATFLADSPILSMPEVRAVRTSILNHASEIGLRLPSARRWPVRIALGDLADQLARGHCNSILEHVAGQITRRSSISVAAEQLKYWLQLYPWFVIFDGLDEVPETGNRAEVLRAISDFLIDAHAATADIVVLATSRPQGYNNEFNQEECRHYELALLTPELAKAYGQNLIDVRLHAGSERAIQVRRRLDRSVTDDSASRLLSTPLQVTILTLLLERLGHAPRDRWRLFSHYYRVIYQREQEKGGELAELLQTHETDVHFVHIHVGLLLQQRGEKSGDARGALTSTELFGIIAKRLHSQGNSAEESDRLANRFVTLATDRLVFLAVLRGDEVGFEIRSLQEFMAAEAFFARPENEAVEAIRLVATSSYWRNVILFAIGHIFANREHLRSEIATLCVALNVDTEVHKAVLPGSRLALDILKERVTASQPSYTEVLAHCACELIKLPKVAFELRHLISADASAQLFDAIDATLSLSEEQASTVLPLLAHLADSGNDAALMRLSTFLSQASEKTRTALAEDIVYFRSKCATSILSAELNEIAPSAIMDHMQIFATDDLDIEVFFRSSEIQYPDFVKDFMIALDAIGGYPGEDDGATYEVISLAGVADLISLYVIPINSATMEQIWDPLVRIKIDGRWCVVRDAAKFVVAPSVATLEQALTTSAKFPSDAIKLARYVPWPLAACLDDARMESSSHAASSRLRALAKLVLAGFLGGPEDWLKAQNLAFRQGLKVNDFAQPVCTVDGEITDVPFSPLSTSGSAFIAGGTYGVTHPDGDDGLKMLDNWVYESYKHICSSELSPGTKRFARMVSFVADVVSDLVARSSYASEIKSYKSLKVDVFSGIMKSASISYPLRMAKILAAQRFDDVLDHLRWLGGLENISGVRDVISSDFTLRCLRIWSVDDTEWRLGRLALHCNPVQVADMTMSLDSEEGPLAFRVKIFADLITLTWNPNRGIVDEKIMSLVDDIVESFSNSHAVHGLDSWTTADSLSISALAQWLQYQSHSTNGSYVAARLAVMLRNRGSRCVDDLLESLYTEFANMACGDQLTLPG